MDGPVRAFAWEGLASLILTGLFAALSAENDAVHVGPPC